MSVNTKAIKPTAIVSITKTGAAYKGSANSTHDTKATWELVNAHIAKNPKCTRQELFKLLQRERNHACFVTYALSRGWLVAK